MVERYGVKALLLGTPFLALLPRLAGSMGSTINARMDMWTASLPLLWKAPLTGLGFGTFSYYYDQVRTEHLTGGWYAHNDYLQIAIENGFPALLVLCFLLITVAATTRRKNLVSFCVILMLTLQAMVEFQFYLPCISIIAGLALAYHRNMGPDLEPRNSRSSMV
jgi:O-antigen ligase